MPTIQIEAQVSNRDLLRAVEQLPANELNHFVEEVLALRSQRDAPRLSATETELLLRINRGLPEDRWQRYEELIGKRRAETLTAAELAELQGCTDEAEQCEADRLAALAQLAQLRQTTLSQLMASLGISPASYD
jgi:hypothetical protein